MAKRMEPMTGRDFELGLALLAGYLNDAMAHPVFEFIGEEELQDFINWAIPCNGNLRQIEAARRNSIDRLRSSAASRVGLSLMLYHQFDPLGTQFQTVCDPGRQQYPDIKLPTTQLQRWPLF
jgi:hypothetical protein